MQHELSSALVPPHLQATGVPLPLRLQASLAIFCNFEPAPQELTEQLPVSTTEYASFRTLQEGLKSGDESSLFLALPAYLQRGLFSMFKQLLNGVPSRDFPVLFHRAAQVLFPDSPPVKPTIGALSKLDSAFKSFSYCFPRGLGPGAGSESTPVQVGSTDFSLGILNNIEAEREKVASLDRSHGRSVSESRLSDTQRSVATPQRIVEILNTHAHSLATISSFGSDESGQLRIIHTAISSECGSILKFFFEPPSETLARLFPSLSVVFLAKHRVPLYVSHQLLKSRSSGAGASLHSAMESSQRNSNLSTLADGLPLKELLAILKGELPAVAVLVAMFSAYRNVVSLGNTFLPVDSSAIFLDLVLFRSFITFVMALFAALGFNASNLCRLVDMAEAISDTLSTVDARRVLSLNLPVAFQSSFDTFGIGIQLWLKVSDPQPPPILTSQVGRLEEVLNSAAALSAFNGLASLGLPKLGFSEQFPPKRPIANEVESADDPRTPSPSKKAKPKPSSGRSGTQGSHVKTLVIKKCKDVGDVVKWGDYYSLTILKAQWEASSKKTWSDNFLSPLLYKGIVKEEVINRTPSSVSAAELRDIISFRSSGALAAAKLEAEPPDFL